MEKVKKFISKYIFWIILVLSIPAIRYLFVYGFFGVSDDLHIAWLYEMDRAIKMLQFPPRYVPDLSYGFGYPLFNFVYPFPFYVGELFHLLGLTLVDSVKIVFGLSIPLSMYFMYKFLKDFLAEELALAGAVLYVYMPYRATELFVRGTIGEIVAFVFIPLVALSVIRLTEEKVAPRWIGITALSTAGLVLSHNIMAYMFMPFALVLLVMRLIWLTENKKAAIIKSFLGFGLGLAASVYFWFPAISESGLVHYDTVFNFYDHFPTLKQFITPFFGYGASVPGPYDTMSFYIGIVGLIVVAVGLVLFAVSFKKFSISEKITFLWGLIIFFASIFMMDYRSAFLWYSIPLLPYFQFPWRFLAMIAFSSPLFLLAFSKFKYVFVISLIVIIASIALNFNYFKTSEYLGRGDSYYINRYIPYPVASEEYKKTGEEYLRLPKDTQVRPTNNYPRAYSDGSEILSINEINALDAQINTNSRSEFVLNYSKYYYPGWFAKIDGRGAIIVPGMPFGQIAVIVPAGAHTVEIYYRESPTRLIFDLISLVSLGVSGWLIFRRTK